MKKIIVIAVLMGLALSASAVDLNVYNRGFDQSAHFTSPIGWDVARTHAGKIYVWNDTVVSTDSRLAWADPGISPISSITQILTDIYPSLTVEDCGRWTVGFDYGWRTDTQGGDCEFTVILIDANTGTVLASSNQVITATGLIDNVETHVGTASLSLSYDTNTVTAGNSLALRIERNDASDATLDWLSTAYIDNITLAALDLASVPAVGPPIWKENPIKGMNQAMAGRVYSDSVAGSTYDVNDETITYGKVGGAAWFIVATNGVLSGIPTDADAGKTNIFTISASTVNGSTNATLKIYVMQAYNGELLTLVNADFEGGGVNKNPNGWIVTENHSGAIYAEDYDLADEYDVTLNMQARGNGNILEQSFLSSEVTADSVGTFDVMVDLGTRSNSGTARSLTVEIWNVTDSNSLASAVYNFPTTGTGFIERKTFTLTYDNTVAELAGDTIALRFTSNGGGNSWMPTHWMDNIVVGVPYSGPVPATILGISKLPGNIIKMVVRTPDAGNLYKPEVRTNLVTSSWSDAAHSVDGSAPWLVTNLSYVTQFESGTNKVIYLQADEAVKFFGIGD